MTQSADIVDAPAGERGPITYPWIISDLTKSGLTPEDFRVEPLRSEAELRERLGFTQVGDVRLLDVGGYWLPYPNAPDFYRLKLREPIKMDSGTMRYLSRKGGGNHAYIPHRVQTALESGDPNEPIFITEGEKKAAKATLDGFPCVALAGVWCFKDKHTDFLPELGAHEWEGRRVYIVYDSDASEKPHVREAESRLAKELSGRGAEVYVVRVPGEPDGSKNGLDDFLCRHGAENFRKLVDKARPATEPYKEATPDIRLKPISAKDLPDIEIPETLWGGILYPGCVTQLNAEPGAGKSTVAYNIAGLGAQGRDFVGEPFPRAIKTLYVDLETPQWLRRQKIESICGERPEGFYLLVGNDDLNLARDIDDLISLCKEGKYDLVILDTQSKVLGLRDENDNSEANRVAAMLTRLTRETGAAILLIHHTSKGGNSKDVYRGRGASALAGSVDIVCNLDVLDADTIKLSITKSRVPAEFQSITMLKAGGDRFERVSAEGRHDTETKLIQEAIEELSKSGVKVNQLALIEHFRGRIAEKRLRSLLKRGAGKFWGDTKGENNEWLYAPINSSTGEQADEDKIRFGASATPSSGGTAEPKNEFILDDFDEEAASL